MNLLNNKWTWLAIGLAAGYFLLPSFLSGFNSGTKSA